MTMLIGLVIVFAVPPAVMWVMMKALTIVARMFASKGGE